MEIKTAHSLIQNIYSQHLIVSLLRRDIEKPEIHHLDRFSVQSLQMTWDIITTGLHGNW